MLSPSDRKQIEIIGERMFNKNRVHFMNAYYKEPKKPFDKQVLTDLFGECYVYHFGVNNTDDVSAVETQAAGRK